MAAATTGATYRGVIRLTTTSSSEKTELATELKAKYGSALGSVGISQAVSQIASQDNVHINEFYDGVTPTKFATDYQTLLDNSQNFPSLFNTQCAGQVADSTQLVCLKSATFKDYQTLALDQANTAALDQAQMNADQLTTYAIGYQNKLNDAAAAQLSPYLFTDTGSEIDALMSTASKQLQHAKLILQQCARDVRDCQAPSAVTPPLPDPETLPSVHQIDLGKPVTCLDYKNKYLAFGEVQKNSPLPEATYRLYLGDQTRRSVNLWCADMNTDVPKEYLTLLQPNYSRLRETATLTLVTLWNKIRINRATLEIDSVDFRYALPVEGSDPIDYGYAGDNINNDLVFPGDIVGNADLRGTNLQFPNSPRVGVQARGATSRVRTRSRLRWWRRITGIPALRAIMRIPWSRPN